MKKLPKDIEYIVGIDEVGRGPLAGPVTVGLVCIPVDFVFDEGITDSKKLTEKKRDAISKDLHILKKEEGIRFEILSASARDIDKKGIAVCIKDLIKKGLDDLGCDYDNTYIFLDGGLKAPEQFKHQETVIKGDSKIQVIGAASIVAKVHRDEYMTKQSQKYPEYYFEKHKGYATEVHRKSILKLGLSPLHRKTYIHFV